MDRILIVEDSPTQAERLRLVLESANYQAEVAGDAPCALQLLEEKSFDMVISDIVMPGMSGYELCQVIKAKPDWREIPVILLTTRKDPMDIFRGLECGADNFYTKPYDPAKLIERVDHVLSNKRLRRQKGRMKLGIEIEFFKKRFVIDSDKEQILDLLISTFEDIVHANLELEKSQAELSEAKKQIEEYARLLEHRAQTSEEMYRAIVDGATNGIVVINEDGVINAVNPAGESIFGHGETEIVGHPFVELLAEPERRRYADDLASYGADGTSRFIGRAPREVEGLRKDGTGFPMQLSVTEIVVGGRRMYIGLAEDLTARRDIERQLRQAQKMEAVGQLAGGIAHDFNNMLTVILGNTELCLDSVPADGTLGRQLHAAHHAAERGAELTRRLLTFSRQQTLEDKTADVGGLVRGMTEMLQRTLGEAIEVRTLSDDDLWLTRVDEAGFENLVLNLAINARDAMSDGGTLTIEASNVCLDETYTAQHPQVADGEYVEVAVSDTGAGMPPEVRDRVFEPFFTTKEKDRGTGLGLSMVYGFVKQLNGHIHVYSEPGCGTSVKIYLPRTREPVSSGAECRPGEAAGSGAMSLTVLIVDDNADVRAVGVSILRSLGCRIVEAENAPQALEILEDRQDIDVLFTDVIMPKGVNGIDLARQARRRYPGIKVLLCSGFTGSSVDIGTALGGNAVFVGKPYRKADLAEKLRQAVAA